MNKKHTMTLWTGKQVETSKATMVKDARAALAPWMERGDKLVRFDDSDAIRFFVSTQGELTDASCKVEL